MKVYFDHEEYFTEPLEVELDYVPRVGEMVLFDSDEFIVESVTTDISNKCVTIMLRDKPIFTKQKTTESSNIYQSAITKAQKDADKAIKDVEHLRNELANLNSTVKHKLSKLDK